MVKIIILGMLMAAAVMASPTKDMNLAEISKVAKVNDLAQEIESNEHLRFRRTTCNALSPIGDATCGAHCISMNKAGGHCVSGMCICRSESFHAVWEQRFGPNRGEEEEQIKISFAKQQ